LEANQVEIQVPYSGVYHLDLSWLDKEWGFTQSPFVAGHEVVGNVDFPLGRR
jgi:uncharacterized zinc-type alcohol dehydrogenase-like protein